MKDLTQLRKQLGYRPFRPFWLETIGGTRIFVEQPDWFIEVPSRESFVVFHGDDTVTFGRFSDLTDLLEVETLKGDQPPLDIIT